MWETFKARMANVHKSHTMMFNLGAIVTTSALAVIPNMHIKTWHMFAAMIVFGAVNMVIRFNTTKDLQDK